MDQGRILLEARKFILELLGHPRAVGLAWSREQQKLSLETWSPGLECGGSTWSCEGSLEA